LCHNAKVVHAFEANTPFEKLPGTQITYRGKISIAPAAPSVPHFPRFRALALFGRRPPRRVDSIVMPASENLHKSGSRSIRRSACASRPGQSFVRSRLRPRCSARLAATARLDSRELQHIVTTTAKQRPHINVRSHAVSFNYLIDRSEEAGWHSNTERFGSLKIDDELEPGWLHHKKPDRRGEYDISRKTIARGMPGDSGVT
jgi:hypothetical protein